MIYKIKNAEEDNQDKIERLLVKLISSGMVSIVIIAIIFVSVIFKK